MTMTTQPLDVVFDYAGVARERKKKDKLHSSRQPKQQQQALSMFNIVTLLMAMVFATTSHQRCSVVQGFVANSNRLRIPFLVPSSSSSCSISSRGNHRLLKMSSGDNAEQQELPKKPPPAKPSGPKPQTFREAEIGGLQAMQEGDYAAALKLFQTALKLPGSRQDIIRVKGIAGPSPVGGSTGGNSESQLVLKCDEFELQAAYYNIACCQTQVGDYDEALEALRQALVNGFDNYDTIRNDPDLQPMIAGLAGDFEKLMKQFEPAKGLLKMQKNDKSSSTMGTNVNKNKGGGGGGFNPFGLLGGGSGSNT